MSKSELKRQDRTRLTRFAIVGIIIAILIVGGASLHTIHTEHAEVVARNAQNRSSKKRVTLASSRKAKATVATSRHMKTNVAANGTVDYTKPSEKKAYPDVNEYPNLWIHVSLERQRTYIMNDNKVLYTMYCSTGIKSASTPSGTYYVQAERGRTFYNYGEGEGANYYTSWSGHGRLLFHTVPIDANGNYIKSEAAKLGKPGGGSRGCVRLTIPDAHWIYTSIKYNTKVVID